MVEQYLVELRARDLIGAIAFRPKTIFEIKLHAFGSTGRNDFAAVLRQKVRVQFFANTEPVKSVHAERQQRFANVKPRELFALEYDHAAAGFGEQCRSRAAGGPATDDRDVVDVDLVHGDHVSKT